MTKYIIMRFISIVFSSLVIFGCSSGSDDAANKQDPDDGGAPGSPGNTAPVAEVTAPGQVSVNMPVNASGSNSSDAEGDTLTYSWQLSVPAGSSASLNSNSTVNVTFTPDVGGSYQLSLTVNDGGSDSEAFVATITASSGGTSNQAPVAQISVANSIVLGNPVNANAANSSDADGDSLTYAWSLQKPNGSNAALSSTTAENINFTPDIAGNYSLTLTVNDGEFDGVAQRSVTAQAALSGQKLTFRNTSGSIASNLPFTFATVFIKGEHSANQEFNLQLSNGELVPIQTDVKATHGDGSLRHAVFSGSLPTLAGNTDVDADLVAVANGPAADVGTLNDLLNSGWDSTVELQVGNTAYSASAADLLGSQPESKWLDGNLVTEWLVAGAFKAANGDEHAHLAARFNVRMYGGVDHVRVSVIVENNWAYEADIKNISYNVTVKINNQTVFTENELNHLLNARWKKDFWNNGEPTLHIMHDATYLMASGAVPNYDASLVSNISNSVINDYNDDWIEEIVIREIGDNGYPVATGSGGTQFNYNKIGPMGIGFAEDAMPTTGSRPDIGPLPRWAAVYLLDQGEASKKVALGMGDLAGSWPIHYRDKSTQRPLSIDDFPYATNHENRNLSRNPQTGDYEQVAQCSSSTVADCLLPYRPDTSHQPSFAFVPYLVTGDHYYMEELMFWANYNFLTMNPGYRGVSEGWFERSLQDRAQAWSMRTLAQTAYITPDNHQLKDYFENKLQSNLDKYEEKYLVTEPNNYGSMIPNYSFPTHSPWMDDFFTWSIGYVAAMGYDSAKPLLDYKSKFPIGRMGFGSQNAQSYCWIFGASYHLLIASDQGEPMFQNISEVYDNTNGQQIPYGGAFDDQGEACGSQAQADALGLRVGEMTGYSASPTGFPSNMQIALAVAVNSGISGSNEAWQQFMNRAVKPDYTGYPNFAIVPRN